MSEMFNCGYDPTCAGWVIREGSRDGEHIATCKTEELANQFVELFCTRSLSHTSSTEPTK